MVAKVQKARSESKTQNREVFKAYQSLDNTQEAFLGLRGSVSGWYIATMVPCTPKPTVVYSLASYSNKLFTPHSEALGC